jgi:acyl-coenzyme A synthetase/AMP-(fatty) acid ligase
MILANLLQPALEASPESLALQWQERCWTYRQLEEAASRLADGLAALGVEPMDRVATLLPNRPELVLTYLACFKAGFIADSRS